MNVKYSFILPVYNVKDYIDRCVESIERQNEDKYEIILVDDGSTDGSSDYIDGLSKTHSKIKVIHKENGGLSSARNEGLKYANGDYIVFVDTDDWISDDFLAVINRTLELNGDCDIVKFNFCRRFSNGNYTERKSSLSPGVYIKSDIKLCILPDAISYSNFTSHKVMLLSAWSHVYKREFLENNNLQFVSERLVGSEDWVFNIKAYALANKLVAIPDCLYNYDEREGSLTQRYVQNFHEKRICLYNTVKSWLLDNGLYDETNKTRLAALYIRMFFYDVLDNECKQKNKEKKEIVATIKSFLQNSVLEECLCIYTKQTLKFKENIYVFLLKHKYANAIYYLKKGK